VLLVAPFPAMWAYSMWLLKQPAGPPEMVPIGILDGQMATQYSDTENFNVRLDSYSFQLDLSPEVAYVRVRGELLAKGWTEKPPEEAHARVGGTRRLLGYCHRFEKHTPKSDMEFGVGPSTRRRTALKADAFLTIVRYTIHPFWEDIERQSNLAPPR
jgi:hypothetical protein